MLLAANGTARPDGYARNGTAWRMLRLGGQAPQPAGEPPWRCELISSP